MIGKENASGGNDAHADDVLRAEFDKIERRAAEKTRSFYIHVFLPWAKANRARTNPWIWMSGRRPGAGSREGKRGQVQ
jgi:hypothetical protein